MIIGIRNDKKAAPVNMCQFWPRGSIKLVICTVKTGWVERKILATRKSFHTQMNWKIPNGGNGRHRKRQGQTAEGCPVVGPIQVGRSEDLARQGTDKVAEQVDGVRQAEAGMEEPDPQEGALHTELYVKLGDGDERHLQRHDLQTDQQGEQPLAAFEVQPGKSVGGQRCENDHQQGGRDGYGQRVEHGNPHPGRVGQVVQAAVEYTRLFVGACLAVRRVGLHAFVTDDGIHVVA